MRVCSTRTKVLNDSIWEGSVRHRAERQLFGDSPDLQPLIVEERQQPNRLGQEDVRQRTPSLEFRIVP